MQTVQINLYTIEELSDKAKERARDWWRQNGELFWCDEARDSIQTFCDHFGAHLRNWNIGPFAPIDYDVQFFNSHFRGMRLSQFKRDHMPTGYCLDCDLWATFYDVFKATGCAPKAFEQALDAGFKAWRDEMEGQHEDDYIDELLEANGYTFTEDGKRFNA